MDLKKTLEKIILKYGKNEGFAIPEIMWSDVNYLSRYGEYQYWLNRILVSNLLNTDKISEEAVASVIFHEYTHQLYRDHNAAFNKRMEQFPDYSKHTKELEKYFNSLTEFPKVPSHNLQLDEKEEIVFCYLPFDPKNEDSYWQNFYHINHSLVGFLPNRITKEYSERTLKQVVWLVQANGLDFYVGWCKNAYIYSKKQELDVSRFGQGKMGYKVRYPSVSGKLLLPPCIQYALNEEERPEKLSKQGICSGSDLDPQVLHEICIDINSYPFEFVDVGITEDAIDCIPGLEAEDVGYLIELSRRDDNLGNRAVWILNKAVALEKSYRTYFERAMALIEIRLFDRAIEDFEQALNYPIKERDDVYDKEWTRDAIEQLKQIVKEFG